MKIEIKDRFTDEIILEGEAEFLKLFLEQNKANLRGADLNGANLSEANLGEANLEGADLIGADLSGANLYKVIIERHQLFQVIKDMKIVIKD